MPAEQLNWQHNKVEIITFLIVLVIIFSSSFQRLDLLIYDWLASHAPTQSSAPQVVLVAIDDNSIEQLGPWPWPRQQHAKLITQLSQAKVNAIGFDILFSQPDNKQPASDLAFEQAIAEFGQVILPIAPVKVDKRITELMPLPNFAKSANKLGHVDIELDSDGIVRTSYLYAGLEQAHWPSFALALAQSIKPQLQPQEAPVNTGQFWVRQQPLLLPFNSRPIQRLSYVDIINGKVTNELLANKIIIVGFTATGLGERFATPLSVKHKSISGAELNAYIVSTLLDQSGYQQLTQDKAIFTNTIVLILVCSLLVLTRTHLVFNILLGSIVILAFSTILLVKFQLWFAPTISLLVLALVATLLSAISNKDKINQLLYQLNYDAITKLLNKNQLKQQFNKQLASEQESNDTEQKSYALLIINLSNFKKVNGVAGFDSGNQVLLQCAKRVQSCLTASQIAARFNGPEFAVLSEVQGESNIDNLSKKLAQQLSQPFNITEHSFTLPINIGIAFYPEDSNNADELFDCAISAMHTAKEQNHNRHNGNKTTNNNICHYSQTTKAELANQNQLENDLAMALERQQLEVFYQPQVNTKTGVITGVEALIRWQHHSHGYIMPNDFIPLAEQTGLIIPIGKWVLTTACQQAKAWRLQGYQLRVAVNLSAIQFAQDDIINDVTNALTQSQLPAQALELEFTESCLMANMESAINKLKRLKRMGVQLSIDDFGTGYSSLSYLKHLPVDRIKIDRLFVNELDSSNEVKEITLAIIAMAHKLNMKVVAEGVERAEQQSFLNNYQCEELQGFYFSKPLPQQKLAKWLASQKTL